jgi:hypothetical protein
LFEQFGIKHEDLFWTFGDACGSALILGGVPERQPAHHPGKYYAV